MQKFVLVFSKKLLHFIAVFGSILVYIFGIGLSALIHRLFADLALGNSRRGFCKVEASDDLSRKF